MMIKNVHVQQMYFDHLHIYLLQDPR
jgi:hypothetical protein